MTLLPDVEKYSLLEGECGIQMGAGLSFRFVGPKFKNGSHVVCL